MRRSPLLLLLMLPALLGQAPSDGGAKAQDSKAKRDFLHALYLDDASSYTIYRDARRQEKLTLRREPAYVWTNPTRNAGQDGHVFVWTARGRAEVVGTIFSSPDIGPREVIHELHSLSLSVLEVDRPGGREGWKPLQPGHRPQGGPGSPEPGEGGPPTADPDEVPRSGNSPPRPSTSASVAGSFASCPSRSTATRAPTPTCSMAPSSPWSRPRGPTPN